MKSLLLKSFTLIVFFACTIVSVHAQGFFGKLKNVVETVANVTDPKPNDSISADSMQFNPKGFVESVPNYMVKKVIETDSLGNQMKNDDGTVRYKYLLIDKDGKVCEKNTAKKHLNKTLKLGGVIIAKVGAAAALGATVGLLKGGSKKEVLIDLGGGACIGLLASIGEMKEIKNQVQLMKECKKVLAAYEKTFTDEGEPMDATVDLTNVDGINFAECEEITKSSEEVKMEFLASKNEGESLEDVEIPEDLKI